MSAPTNQYDLVSYNKRQTILVIFIFIAAISLIGYVCYLAGIAPLELMAICFFASATWSLISYFFSDKIILSYSHAVPATKKDHYDFYTVTENLCFGSNLPLPKLYVINDPALNAFATGRNPEHAVVAVTTGLLQTLNRHELEAVIGHELSHIRHYDILLSSLIAVLAGALTMTLDIILRSHFRFSSKKDDRHNNALLIVLAYLLAIIAPILLDLLQLALSRRREYLADAGSVELTRNPKAMIKALQKIDTDPRPIAHLSGATAELFIVDPFKKKTFLQKIQNLFATHPPITSRIAALEKLI
jgi:heat shock protein HtpX